jgi:hypothetical protein
MPSYVNYFKTKTLKYVSNFYSQPKSSRKGNLITFLKLFLNAIIRNIKI